MAVVLISRNAKSLFTFVFAVLFGLFLLSSSVECVPNPGATGFTGYITENVAFNGLSADIVKPCSGVYNTSPVLLWVRHPSCTLFRPHRARSLLSSFIAFLLLTVVSNPGLPAVRFGALNAGNARAR